jgi:hypothetical protein
MAEFGIRGVKTSSSALMILVVLMVQFRVHSVCYLTSLVSNAHAEISHKYEKQKWYEK